MYNNRESHYEKLITGGVFCKSESDPDFFETDSKE